MENDNRASSEMRQGAQKDNSAQAKSSSEIQKDSNETAVLLQGDESEKKSVNEIMKASLKKQESPKSKIWNINKVMMFSVALSAVFLATIIWLWMDSIAVGVSAAADSYGEKKEQVEEAVYDTFYQKSYEISEKKHHVSNDIAITIGNLQEQSKLEVLKICDVAYKITPAKEKNLLEAILGAVQENPSDELESWFEVPANGVFVVDLKSAEFIVDNARQYVLIRVPNPELSEFTIDYAGVNLLYFEDGGLLKKSAAVGEDMAREMLQSAELELLQEANSNQQYYKNATENAKKILTNLVKQLNPDVPDLLVEVEIIE